MATKFFPAKKPTQIVDETPGTIFVTITSGELVPGGRFKVKKGTRRRTVVLRDATTKAVFDAINEAIVAND